MFEIVYSDHLKQRMIKRKITRKQVEYTIESPDYVDLDEQGHERAHKRFGNRIVRVVYQETNTGTYLITAMKLHPDDMKYI